MTPILKTKNWKSKALKLDDVYVKMNDWAGFYKILSLCKSM